MGCGSVHGRLCRGVLTPTGAGAGGRPCNDAIAALPAAYAAAGGREIAEDAFAWYLAATLLGRQVKTCVRCLPTGAAELSAELLALAQALGSAGDVP